ncbi:MAG TPA: winged helix-turn-helix transcriptional regulator [Chitinophagales bacterium]|nr:winged helix-turn-helix transcriptional regulator [Chitinophagales bacterium]
MIELDLKKVKAAVMVLRSIRNPLRTKILALIDANPGITVSEIFSRMRLEQSVTSLHVGSLRRSGIVRTERAGKKIHYYADYENIKAISLLVNQLAKYYKGTRSKKVKDSTSSTQPTKRIY